MKQDAIVAGAGVVGVCVALHLAGTGRSVTLVDRAAPGTGTSFGNAGLIERSSVVPYAFPRRLADLIRVAARQAPGVSYQIGHLLAAAPWLFGYWRESAPARLRQAAADMLPLVRLCVEEHDRLAAEAGAEGLFARRGWIEAFTSSRNRDRAFAATEDLGGHGLSFDRLDGAALRALEPHVAEGIAGAIHWRDPVSVTDPLRLTEAYADLLLRRGGRIVRGDARTLLEDPAGWSVRTGDGVVTARDAVLCLGPWSDDVFRPLGYRIPLEVKRGYHMHFAPEGGARLGHSIVHDEGGYVLAAMDRGIRLTTGVEIAGRNAPPSTRPLDRALAIARGIFPLGPALDAEPWLGRRPALPDMRPVIGPAPRHRGLWFAFGHAHHGLTLAAVTGRLVAEMVAGRETVVDPRPYAATRFG